MMQNDSTTKEVISKMGEPKSDLKDDGLKDSISIDIKKMEPIINAQQIEEKVGKEKKKEEKGAKAAEKKDGGPDEAKIGDKGKKKAKEDDGKDKEKPEKQKKKPKEVKKVKEEKTNEDKKSVGAPAPPANSLDETSSEGVDGKKGVKKTKKTKNKKNQQAAGDEGSSESAVKKPEKKDSGSEPVQKKKADKKESKKDGGVGGTADSEILARLIKLETENKKLKSLAEDVKKITNNVNQLISRMSALEKGVKAPSNTSASQISQKSEEKPKKKDDDDVDLFGSDEEEDADMLKIKADRLKMYEDKKAKKPGVIAKSNIILDVKPWDDETNMKTMEDKVRLVTCDGLLWGASKLVPLAYGIHKLQISCVIEDEKVSVDWLQEQIEANEDLVQSVDIAAFNKV